MGQHITMATTKNDLELSTSIKNYMFHKLYVEELLKFDKLQKAISIKKFKS